MRKLSANLLALSLHLSQASCSPSSRRISPAASIQIPTPSGPGKPCCAGCTCDCRCNKAPTDTRDSSRSQSKSSEPRRGREEGSRGGSRAPSTKRAASRPSQDSGRREATPTRDQRTGSRRPEEGRAPSTRDQSVPRAVLAQTHDNLPLRGRTTAIDQQAGTSDVQDRAARSKSRGRDAAAGGHYRQEPEDTMPLPRPPPLPQAAGVSGPVPGQQQQHQSQRPPRGQAGQAMQPRRDQQYAPVSSNTRQQGAAASTQAHLHGQQPQARGRAPGALQQPPHDPFQGPGPSYQTQAGPSSFSTPSGAAVPPDVGGPSQPQRQQDETPVKKKKDKKGTPLKGMFPFGKKKDKGDKK